MDWKKAVKFLLRRAVHSLVSRWSPSCLPGSYIYSLNDFCSVYFTNYYLVMHDLLTICSSIFKSILICACALNDCYSICSVKRSSFICNPLKVIWLVFFNNFIFLPKHVKIILYVTFKSLWWISWKQIIRILS